MNSNTRRVFQFKTWIFLCRGETVSFPLLLHARPAATQIWLQLLLSGEKLPGQALRCGCLAGGRGRPAICPGGPQSPPHPRRERKLPLSGAACDQLLGLSGATVANCTALWPA